MFTPSVLDLLPDGADFSKIALTMFGAKWCKPCAAVKPYVEKLASPHLDVHYFDIEAEPTGRTRRKCGRFPRSS